MDMKRIFFIIAACFIAIGSISAQSLEQRKICALKWTLQQAFYNKQEGQQISRISVTEYNSLADFQKNKLISDAIKKLQDKADQNRVSTIMTATAESDVNSCVPSGAKKEYQADVDRMKAVAPAVEPAAEDEETPEEEASAPAAEQAEASEPELVEPAPEATADTDVDETDDAAAISAPAEGLSFVAVALTCLAIYLILTLCIYFFIRSRRTSQKSEEMVTMDQYRNERVRLIERIKALEIEVENVKNMHPAVAAEPVKPEEKPQPEPEPVEEPVVEPVVEEPVVVETPAQPEPEPVVEPAKPEPAEPEPVKEHTLFEQPAAPAAPLAGVEIPHTKLKSSIVMFYTVPVDGVFVGGSSEIEPGKSFYMLKTIDGQHGTFQILNTSENISLALADLTEKVKPACKIMNTVVQPVEILAERPGEVEREGNGWRITSKALVRLI